MLLLVCSYTTTRNLRKTLFKAPGTCPCPVPPPEEPHPLLMGKENISVRFFKMPFFCPSVLHCVEAWVHGAQPNVDLPKKVMHLGSGTQEDQMQCGVKRLVKGCVCGRRGHRGKGSTHLTDTTGHNRTRPDTDRTQTGHIGHLSFRTSTHMILSKTHRTLVTTGHYRTLPGITGHKNRTSTGHATGHDRTCFRT